MSQKQEIYQDMIRWAIPHIRNIQTQSWIVKAFNKSCHFESELVHNLMVSILDEEFTDHDIWFLNTQARWYFEKCSSKVSPNYERQIENIIQLFSLIPEKMRSSLSWSGPNIIKEETT